MTSERGGQVRVANATTKLSKYATSGTIQTSGSAATFWLMCVVIAARSTDAHAASAIHSTRVVSGIPSDSAVGVASPSSLAFRTEAPITPTTIASTASTMAMRIV